MQINGGYYATQKDYVVLGQYQVFMLAKRAKIKNNQNWFNCEYEDSLADWWSLN
jgi:hypothetical protein